MASVVRLAVGTLSSALRQAASLTSSTPHRLLSLATPRLCSSSSTHPPQHSFATCSRSLAQPSSMIRSSSSSSSSWLLSSSSSLSPVSSLLQRCGPALSVQSFRSYHVRVALKKRCSSCFFVRRKGRLFVECKSKPRHKQMQVMSKRKTWKEDYSEGNIQRAIHWNYHRDHGYYKLGDNEYARHDWLKGKIGVTV